MSTVGRWVAVAGIACLVVACERAQTSPGATEAVETSAVSVRSIDPPAAVGSFAPRLSSDGNEALLAWWESLPAPQGERRHRLMFARYDGQWSDARVISEGGDYFANWADLPSVMREPSGALLAHWLEKTAGDTYAYSIFLARSTDDGASWQPLGKLNDDSTDTEHGFVSMVVEGEAVRAYWLDGRQMAEDGPMTVRSALIGEGIGSSELLDDRVCECCATDAVATSDGSLVVFRDRSEDETREMHAVRRSAGQWSESIPVTADNWKIPGCPVNGPAIDSTDDRTAVAWFTGIEDAPRVAVAFSPDFGVDLEAATIVDGEKPLGRVGLVLDDTGEAIVSWLSIDGTEAEVRLRRVAANGAMSESLVLGRTSAGRSSGVPQLARLDDRLLAAWVEVSPDADPVIRVRELPANAVGAARPGGG